MRGTQASSCTGARAGASPCTHSCTFWPNTCTNHARSSSYRSNAGNHHADANSNPSNTYNTYLRYSMFLQGTFGDVRCAHSVWSSTPLCGKAGCMWSSAQCCGDAVPVLCVLPSRGIQLCVWPCDYLQRRPRDIL